MKKGKVTGITLYLLFLAVLLALYYGFVYTNLSQKTSALSSQHTLNTQQLSLYQSMILDKASMQKSINNLIAKTKDTGKVLGIPASKLGEDISTGLKSAGITAQNITMSDASVSGNKKASNGRVLTQVTVSLTMDCTESQLTKLLDYYEKKTSAVYYVNNLNIRTKSQQGQKSSSGNTVTLDMTAYYYASPSAVSSVKATS